MADKNRFPQIPSTVWWGVRNILQRSPNVTIDERLLGVELNVQPAAAKQYVAELRSVGILNEENKATPLAARWRLDDTYQEAVGEIIAAAYPQGLRDVSSPQDGDRKKAKSWFMQEGLGEGAAGNKAATYFLIGSEQPGDAPTRSTGQVRGEGTRKAPAKQPAGKGSSERPVKEEVRQEAVHKVVPQMKNSVMPLNVNVQIHISAEAGTEQIDAIFAAMRRYLYEQQGS